MNPEIEQAKNETLATMEIQSQRFTPEDQRVLLDELIEELCARAEKYDEAHARQRRTGA